MASLDHLLDVPVVVLDRVGQRQPISDWRNKVNDAARVREVIKTRQARGKQGGLGSRR